MKIAEWLKKFLEKFTKKEKKKKNRLTKKQKKEYDYYMRKAEIEDFLKLKKIHSLHKAANGLYRNEEDIE